MENAPLSLEYSLPELIGFLEYLAEKGLANKNTVDARKAACNKMLSILDPGEKADLRHLDVDHLATRFAHLKGKSYSPQSLQVYKSRVLSSIADFLRYKENPANFKMASQPVKSLVTSGKKSSTSKKVQSESTTKPVVLSKLLTEQPLGSATINFPVPLRPNCVVQINGLPVDLTKAEAAKIAAVVSAMISVDLT